jgi:hypothetical protein
MTSGHVVPVDVLLAAKASARCPVIIYDMASFVAAATTDDARHSCCPDLLPGGFAAIFNP